MTILNTFCDFFLPRFCPGCKSKLLPDENVICNSCHSKIKYAEEERLHHEFSRKFEEEKIVSGFASLFIFEKEKELQHIIHALKYDGKFNVGKHLGKKLANELRNKFDEWEIDLIVPVPLHHLRRAERGYNQSFFIAKGIESVLKIRVRPNLLKRNRFTETQTSMNLVERKENMKDAFSVRRKKTIARKRILLLDDVITTGSTISECGKILLENGASKIFAASVAIAD